jgi:alginate O-acetyltransferase complex protein AlgI
MPFTSLTFLLLFLPATVALVAGARRRPWRTWLLLVLSLLFYAWGQGASVLVLALSMLGNWACGLLAGRAREERTRRVLLAAGLAGNLGLLLALRYLTQVAATVNAVLSLAGLPALLVGLPAGLSFYTLQGMAYLIGISRGDVKAERSFGRAGTLLGLFPGLLAGPIVRAAQMQPQLDGARATWSGVASGGRRFVVGLAKKVLLADVLARAVDGILGQVSSSLSPSLAWLALVAYSLQIYFDFSGYSDMAVGLAQALGFVYPENFDHPYSSRSVSEFWRRWHMTLSFWFRDFVFLPVSYVVSRRLDRFNLRPRSEALCSYAAGTALTMLLIGLWHGASWHFLAWGAYFAVLLVLERTRLGTVLLRAAPGPLRQLWVVGAVMLGWTMFRLASFSEIRAWLGAMAGLGYGDSEPLWRYATPEVVLAICFGAFGSLGGGQWLRRLVDHVATARLLKGYSTDRTWAWVSVLVTALLLTVCLSALAASTVTPFIYSGF